MSYYWNPRTKRIVYVEIDDDTDVPGCIIELSPVGETEEDPQERQREHQSKYRTGPVGKEKNRVGMLKARREKMTGAKHSPKPCCGSLGPRHMKGCPQAKKVGADSSRHTVGDRNTFSEKTYTTVKEMLETVGVDFIVREKGLEEDEVRRANLADGYEDYLQVA